MRRALLLAVLLLLPGCVARQTAQEEGHTIEVDGKKRTFTLFRPSSLPEKAPLVVMLHGGFGTGAQAQSAYGWDELAEEDHFVVAYPDGLNRAWSVGGGCCGEPGRNGVNDVAFIEKMIERIGELVPIDRSRVYATGMSNGAMFSYRLACDSKLFAAIAPVAGTMLGACTSPAPTSVLHIHGLADMNVRFDGERGEGVAKIDGPPVPEVIAHWRTFDNCAPPKETTVDAAKEFTRRPADTTETPRENSKAAVTTSIATCSDGRIVELVTIAGAGHQWPGGDRKPLAERIIGTDTPSAAVNGTQIIWKFFVLHGL